MNKEEKEAIEKFENLLKKHFEDKKIDSLDYLDYFEGVTILNLIENQQKEIERLKNEYKREVFEHQEFVEDTKVAVQDYIKKYKIKDLIKEKAKTDTYNFKTIAVKDIEELLGE